MKQIIIDKRTLEVILTDQKVEQQSLIVDELCQLSEAGISVVGGSEVFSQKQNPSYVGEDLCR